MNVPLTVVTQRDERGCPRPQAPALAGQEGGDTFLPYVRSYVDRAEANGYDRAEIVGRLLELLDKVSSHPAPDTGNG